MKVVVEQFQRRKGAPTEWMATLCGMLREDDPNIFVRFAGEKEQEARDALAGYINDRIKGLQDALVELKGTTS